MLQINRLKRQALVSIYKKSGARTNFFLNKFRLRNKNLLIILSCLQKLTIGINSLWLIKLTLRRGSTINCNFLPFNNGYYELRKYLNQVNLFLGMSCETA